MLSQSINSNSWSLHDDLLKEVKVLFSKLAIVSGEQVKIKNNIPQLARIIFKGSQVKLWKDIMPVAKIILQIRDDGYDISSVVTVIGIAYNSVIEEKKPKVPSNTNLNMAKDKLQEAQDSLAGLFGNNSRNTWGKMPNFGEDLAGILNDDFMEKFGLGKTGWKK